MSNHYWGVTVPGATQFTGGVTKGTSTTGKSLELVLLDGSIAADKTALLNGLAALRAYIETDNPPV